MSMRLNPRREAKKESIEADTDPMKEVLHLRATFAPTPAQQMAQGNICSHSHTKNYSVKFGPRRETVKEIIEVYQCQQKPLLYHVKLSL